MGKLYPNLREIVVALILLALMVAGFAVLSIYTGYPHGNEWQGAIYVALAVAALPILFRILFFLQQTRSVLDFKGVKIDFGKTAAIPAVQLTENVVEKGHSVSDSGTQEVLKVARAAERSAAVVVDLKNGDAWYKTRLFALAAAGLEFDHPRLIVFLATLDGSPASFLGFVEAKTIARAIMQDDLYRDAYKVAATKYHQLAAFADQSLIPLNLQLQAPVQQGAWNFEGRPSFMTLLIQEMERFESPISPWINAVQVRELLADDLHTDSIQERAKDQDAILRFLSSRAEYAALLNGRRFLGLVPVERVMRELMVTLSG